MIEIAEAFLWLGGIVTLIGTLGLLRFPDFYTRTHAATLVAVGGFTLALTGLALYNPLGANFFKIILILAINFITNPTATHALADSAYRLGIRPVKLVKNDMSSGRPKGISERRGGGSK
jgi:multicomponent Na+:H+ antiporter subunit G